MISEPQLVPKIEVNTVDSEYLISFNMMISLSSAVKESLHSTMVDYNKKSAGAGHMDREQTHPNVRWI